MRLPMSGVIVFTVSDHCNAGCEYCYLRHMPKSEHPRLMDQGEIELVFSRYAREMRRAGFHGAGVYWHGGDPLHLDPSWTSAGCDIITDVFEGYGLNVSHAVQSNMMVMDQVRGDLVRRKFKYSLGSSLDYPNLYRRYGSLAGDEYNERWKRNYELLKSYGADTSAISLANVETIKTDPSAFLEYYFKHIGLNSVQINFPFGHGFWLDPLELGNWLRKMLDIWYEDLEFHQISPFSHIYRRIHWDRGQLFYDGLCALDIDCTRAVIGISHTGDVYQCDIWRHDTVGNDYGNLFNDANIADILNAPARQRLSDRWIHLKKCHQCPWARTCWGGCPRRAYESTGDLYQPDHYCETFRALFEGIANRRSARFDRCANAMSVNSRPGPQGAGPLSGGPQCGAR